MKIFAVGIKRVLASAALVAGLLYSMVALTAKPAYGAACDCDAELSTAEVVCENLDSRLMQFICPYDGMDNRYYFKCENGDFYIPYCPA